MRSCSQSNISTSKTQFNFIRICDTLFILKICILNLSKIYMHRPNIRSVSDSGPYRNTTGELGLLFLSWLDDVVGRRILLPSLSRGAISSTQQTKPFPFSSASPFPLARGTGWIDGDGQPGHRHSSCVAE
jgi:hypothetical protein